MTLRNDFFCKKIYVLCNISGGTIKSPNKISDLFFVALAFVKKELMYFQCICSLLTCDFLPEPLRHQFGFWT